jgi:hypothetical protein
MGRDGSAGDAVIKAVQSEMQILSMQIFNTGSRPGRRIVSVFLFASVLVVSGYAQDTGATAKDDVFKTLLTKLKGGDTKIDFKALRMASLDSKSDDAGQPDEEQYKKAVEAYTSKKYKAAISAGEKSLDKGYLGIDAHLLVAVAHREAGNNEKFDFHKAVYLGLVNSIISGADGKSAKTAYVVIDVAEEYALLRALGLDRGSQALRADGGHKYDVLTVTDPKTNQTQQLWFNIDAVWKGYEKLFK